MRLKILAGMIPVAFLVASNPASAAPMKTERSVHPKDGPPCTGCHNPHNSKKKKLRL